MIVFPTLRFVRKEVERSEESRSSLKDTYIPATARTSRAWSCRRGAFFGMFHVVNLSGHWRHSIAWVGLYFRRAGTTGKTFCCFVGF